METETQIHTESLRYSCDIPGQALAYKLGSRQIHELRDQAAKAQGCEIRSARVSRLGAARRRDAALGPRRPCGVLRP